MAGAAQLGAVAVDVGEVAARWATVVTVAEHLAGLREREAGGLRVADERDTTESASSE